jgi:hypothetical protein
VNITESPYWWSSTTFSSADGSNFGLWRTVNFSGIPDNIYFTDTTDGPNNVYLDSFSSSDYDRFHLFRLTNDSDYLSYLANPLTLYTGTIIVGWNDGYTGDADYDDIIIAMTRNPVPEPVSMLLFGTGLIGIGGYARRRFKK